MTAADFWIDVAPLIVMGLVALVVVASAVVTAFGITALYRFLRDERAAQTNVVPIRPATEPEDFDDIDRELARLLADDCPVVQLRPARVIQFPPRGGAA